MKPPWTIKRKSNVVRTKYATIHFSWLRNDLLDDLCARVDNSVEHVSSYLRTKPPELMEIQVCDHPRVSIANYDTDTIVVARDRLPDRTAIVHELTHLIAGRSCDASGLLDEGLAVHLQEKFGGPGDRSFPTMGLNLHQEAVRLMAECNGALPLTETAAVRRSTHHKNPRRTLAYLQQGSFVRVLSETYGLENLMRVYRGSTSWIDAFGLTSDALEIKWLEWLSNIYGQLERAGVHSRPSDER